MRKIMAIAAIVLGLALSGCLAHQPTAPAPVTGTHYPLTWPPGGSG
jgi:hypothetical protein